VFSGLQFSIPMLVVICGTLAVGTIPVLWAWIRISGERKNAGRRAMPKALCALTASVIVILVGFVVFFAVPDRINAYAGHLIWFVFFAIGAVLNLAALVLSHERHVTRVTVLNGSIAVAAVHLLGLVLFYWGG